MWYPRSPIFFFCAILANPRDRCVCRRERGGEILLCVYGRTRSFEMKVRSGVTAVVAALS